jgi:dihydrofolate reductase
MGKVVVFTSVTLDGVMQAPRRPDEDPRVEYVLLIHPIVLGTGRRIFQDGIPISTLDLVGTKTTSTGVVIATYQPTRGA